MILIHQLKNSDFFGLKKPIVCWLQGVYFKYKDINKQIKAKTMEKDIS